MLLVSAVLLSGCSSAGQQDDEVAATAASPTPFTTSAQSAALNFGATGLPIVSVVDATASVCPDAGCTEATTTDYVDFFVFPDEESAVAFATENPDQTDQRGTLVMQFTALTTADQRPLFEQALQQLP